jgi:hypothetical protein
MWTYDAMFDAVYCVFVWTWMWLLSLLASSRRRSVVVCCL